MSMREKVAKAIYEQRNGAGAVPWSRRDNAHKGPYLDDADVALGALMSPSANMIDEGIDADENSFDGLTQVATIFTAMIQAAKEGK